MNYELDEFNPEILQKIIRSNILLYCVVLLLVLRIAAVAVSINFPQNIFFADITKVTLENLVNQTRQSAGLPALAENEKLNQAAQLKAENMVQNGYFDHVSPTGVTPWFWFLKAGYNYKYAGENLAIGFFDSEEVFNAWLNSPSHKANIVNPNYKEMGTAVLGGFGSNNTIVVVQEFASQLPAKSVAVKNTETNTVVTEPEPVKETAVTTEVETKTEEKVLSQTIESKVSLESPKTGVANNLSLKIANFVVYNSDDLLQSVIYGVSLVVIGILLMLIFSSINFDFKREFVFRSILILVLLFTAAIANNDMILSLIPHQVTII